MSLTPLEPQVRFGDKLLEVWVVYAHNGTAVLKGLRRVYANIEWLRRTNIEQNYWSMSITYWNQAISKRNGEINVFFPSKLRSSRGFLESDPETSRTSSVPSCRGGGASVFFLSAGYPGTQKAQYSEKPGDPQIIGGKKQTKLAPPPYAPRLKGAKGVCQVSGSLTEEAWISDVNNISDGIPEPARVR